MRIHGITSAAMIVVAVTVTAATAQLPDVPTGSIEVRLDLVATGLSAVEPGSGVTQVAPTKLVPGGSARLFVTTLGGVVRLVDQSQLLSAAYLDTTNPNSFNDPGRHGMTAMAFHPDFYNPGQAGYRRVYTIGDELLGSGSGGTWDFPTSAPDSSSPVTPFDQVLLEWIADDPDADMFSGSSRELFRVRQPKDDHNINDLEFGPDGCLYVAVGNGGNVRLHQLPPPGMEGLSDNAQRLDVIFGKVLRIDPLDPNLPPTSTDPVSANGNYRIAQGNPLVGIAGQVEEIYSWGHRNPYRINFDPVSANLYAGDVGQRSIESVDDVTLGGNFGWNLKEGSFVFDFDTQTVTPDVDTGSGTVAGNFGLTDPIFEYDHADGRAVVGGFVYRGSDVAALVGKYVFADFQGGPQGGRLFYGDLATGDLFEFQLDASGTALPDLVYSLGQDDAGELYVLGGPFNASDGVVLRIVPEPAAVGWIGAFGLLTRRRRGGVT